MRSLRGTGRTCRCKILLQTFFYENARYRVIDNSCHPFARALPPARRGSRMLQFQHTMPAGRTLSCRQSVPRMPPETRPPAPPGGSRFGGHLALNEPDDGCENCTGNPTAHRLADQGADISRTSSTRECRNQCRNGPWRPVHLVRIAEVYGLYERFGSFDSSAVIARSMTVNR